MDTLMWILGSTMTVSLISLTGVITLSLSDRLQSKLLLLLIAFAAGALMGGAFLHLFPESLEELDVETASIYLISGFSIFFILERILRWRHCHNGVCDIHAFTYLNLVGDAIHNFGDGLIIAASFLADINLGIVTTLAVIAHEIPQELGDFAVLVYGGFTKRRALFYNFLSALTAIIGALTGYFLPNYIEHSTILLLPIAAGGFLYISSSDLIPELHKEKDMNKSLLSFASFLMGILLMWSLKFVIGH